MRQRTTTNQIDTNSSHGVLRGCQAPAKFGTNLVGAERRGFTASHAPIAENAHGSSLTHSVKDVPSAQRKKRSDSDGLGKIPNNGAVSESKRTRQTSMRYSLQDSAKKLLKGWRVCVCGENVVNTESNVKLQKEFSGEYCNYTNLWQCGSIWTCAVCAVNKSEKKAKKVRLAMNMPTVATVQNL